MAVSWSASNATSRWAYGASGTASSPTWRPNPPRRVRRGPEEYPGAAGVHMSRVGSCRTAGAASCARTPTTFFPETAAVAPAAQRKPLPDRPAAIRQRDGREPDPVAAGPDEPAAVMSHLDRRAEPGKRPTRRSRSEEHTSEL